MTIYEAIERVDGLKFNTYPLEEKMLWLSELEGSIVHQIIKRHSGGEAVSFQGFDAETDPQTKLLVDAPFDSIYLRWLEAQIDYHNGEFEKFNAAILLYNTAWENFENHYKQTHRPLSAGCRFLF